MFTHSKVSLRVNEIRELFVTRIESDKIKTEGVELECVFRVYAVKTEALQLKLFACNFDAAQNGNHNIISKQIIVMALINFVLFCNRSLAPPAPPSVCLCVCVCKG